MGHAGFKSVLALVATLLLATGAFAADDESRVEHDRAKLSVFGQASISFLNFEERSYFQNAIDTIYADFRSQAVDAEESLYVAKQNFQKVNFCFPIMGGIQYQVFNDQFISAGIGYIYSPTARTMRTITATPSRAYRCSWNTGSPSPQA